MLAKSIGQNKINVLGGMKMFKTQDKFPIQLENYTRKKKKNTYDMKRFKNVCKDQWEVRKKTC